MFLTYTAATSDMISKEVSDRVRKVLNTPLDADITYSESAPRSDDTGDQKYGSSHGDDKKKQWSAWDFLVLTSIILGVVLYVVLIATAAYTTSNSSGYEMFWSISFAILVPEIYVFYHGIDAARLGISFFDKIHQK